jgi:AcrR family transcriptional regulator
MEPEDRREQLVMVASGLLSASGPDGVSVSSLAHAAGVSRPVVYRFFAGRHAIIVAVLEAFEAGLHARFFAIEPERLAPANLEAAVEIFVMALCDTIEERGAGAWRLLDAAGPDPTIAAVGQAIMARMVDPWRDAVGAATGCTPAEVEALCRMLVASGRAALSLWLDGAATRAQAVAYASVGIGGLLAGFRDGGPTTV